MPGIGVVFNPRSGHNVRDPRAAHRLAKTLGDHGVVRQAGSLDELYRVAEDFRRLGIDVLGISGGDGTNGTTITGFIDVYQGSALPQIAFLRGGTMNTVANAIGVRRGPPEGLLERLCRAYAERSARPLANVERHVMCIKGDGARRPEGARREDEAPASATSPVLGMKYGFNFGTGVVRGFLSEYYAAGSRPNPLVAAKTLLRGAGSAAIGGEMVRRMAEPFRAEVELADGTIWPERDYLTITGGTVDQIGLNFRPYYRFAEQPNTFHLLGIYTSPLGFVGQLPRIWRAKPMTPGHAYDAVTARAVLRAARSPLKYMIDGDLYECDRELHVSTGPRVRIVVGT